MFCAFATVAVLAALGYSLGSAGRMGPGYFPLALGIVLALLGAMLIGRALVLDGEPLPPIHAAPLAVMAIAVCLFGVMIEPMGLVLSLAVLIGLTAWARPQFQVVETAALAAVLIAFSVAVFVYLLGLPLAIWPSL
jgi:hypothetical protein